MNDIHISPTNIPDVLLNFREAFDICEKNGVDEIIVDGDLFTSREAQRLNVLIALGDIFREAGKRGINIILSPGNHDKVDQEKIESYCHIFSEFGNITVVDEYMLIEHENVCIHIIPYFPESGSFKERLSKVSTVAGKVNILSIHEGINGALSHSSEASNKELPTNIFDRFDTTLVGHYHNRVKIAGTNIQYVGASRQHNFGEDIKKGYTLISSDGEIKFIRNKVNNQYMDISFDFDEIGIELFEKIQDNVDIGFYVRAVISCTTSQRTLIDKNKLREAGVSKIKIVDTSNTKDITHKPMAAQFDRKGLIEYYKKFSEEKGIDPDFGIKFL